MAGVILKRYTLPAVVSVHIILWVDGLPTFEIFLGLLAHACYWKLLESYPILTIKSYEAPMSIFMFLISHYFWFTYFSEPNVYGMPGRDILHIVGFFVVLVWTIPMGLFVTLTISDNVLPSAGNTSTDHLKRTTDLTAHKKGANVFKTVYDFFQHMVETAAEYSYTGGGKAKKYKSPGGNLNNSSSGGGNYLHEHSSAPSTGDNYRPPYGHTPQPGQYSAFQFATNRTQAQHGNAMYTHKPAPSAANRGKAD